MRQHFHRAMDAWQGIQHMCFGPVELFLRYNRFQLWPDKRNTGTRQLARVLAEQDPGLLKAERFRRTSVALQGLGTLEQLLFTDGSVAELFGKADKSGYRCGLVVAIAANVAEMSSGIVSDWTRAETPYRSVIADAIDQPLYRIAGSPAKRPRLDRLLQRCSALKRLIYTELPRSLDIPLGFNSLDGD